MLPLLVLLLLLLSGTGECVQLQAGSSSTLQHQYRVFVNSGRRQPRQLLAPPPPPPSLLLAASSSRVPRAQKTDDAETKRQVFLWLNPQWMNMSWFRQTVNTSWQIDGRPIIDGIYLMCGPSLAVVNGAARIVMNETDYEIKCGEYGRQAAALGIEIHTFLTDVPDEALTDPSGVIESGIALARKFNWSGFNIDDESECAPRSDLENFTKWVHGLDTIQRGFAPHKLALSVDVQAVWGIEPGPYVRHAPCQRAPWVSNDHRVISVTCQKKL